MDIKDIIITQLYNPFTVVSHKGRVVEVNSRKNYGLSFCMEGQVTYTLNGKAVISDPSRVVLLPKGQTYTLHFDKEGQFSVINFECTGFDYTEILSFPIANPDSYIKQYETMRNTMRSEENKLKSFSIFYSLLDQLLVEQNDPDDLFTKIGKFIETNISNPNLTNALIAQHVNISEVYFRKRFTKKFKISPKQYIIDIRIQKAKQLLTETNFSVTAIAEECGFSSLYLFSRCFKEKTGHTPTAYAKLFKKTAI